MVRWLSVLVFQCFSGLETVMKAYSYVRFSSLQQASGLSLLRQTSMTEAYCQRNGLILDRSLTLHDLGVSGFKGKNAKTGALGRFLRAIEDGTIASGSILIVENLDRLSRDQVTEAIHTFRQIIRAGVSVVTLKPEREYSASNIGDEPTFFEAMFDLMRAHRESQRKSDLAKANWSQKRNRLRETPLTRNMPAWLKLVNGKFVPIDSHVEIVKQIFDWALAGHGLVSITKKLNRQGRFIARAKHWSKGYVSRIVRNRSVLGEFQPHTLDSGVRKPVGAVVSDYYPRIISDDDFYRVQNAVNSRRGRGGRTGDGVTNLFSHLVFDAHDRSPMSIVHKGTLRLVSSAAQRGENGAVYRGFPYDAFELGIIRWLSELSPVDLLTTDRDRRTASKLAKAESKLCDLDGRIETIQQRLTNDPAFVSLLDVLQKLDKERRETAQLVETLRADKSASGDMDALGLIRRLADVSSEDRYDLRTRVKASIRHLVERIDVDVERNTIDRVALVTIKLRTGSVRHVQIMAKRGMPTIFHRVIGDEWSATLPGGVWEGMAQMQAERVLLVHKA